MKATFLRYGPSRDSVFPHQREFGATYRLPTIDTEMLTGLLKKSMEDKHIVIVTSLQEVITTLNVDFLKGCIVTIKVFVELFLRHAFDLFIIVRSWYRVIDRCVPGDFHADIGEPTKIIFEKSACLKEAGAFGDSSEMGRCGPIV